MYYRPESVSLYCLKNIGILGNNSSCNASFLVKKSSLTHSLDAVNAKSLSCALYIVFDLHFPSSFRVRKYNGLSSIANNCNHVSSIISLLSHSIGSSHRSNPHPGRSRLPSSPCISKIFHS